MHHHLAHCHALPILFLRHEHRRAMQMRCPVVRKPYQLGRPSGKTTLESCWPTKQQRTTSSKVTKILPGSDARSPLLGARVCSSSASHDITTRVSEPLQRSSGYLISYQFMWKPNIAVEHCQASNSKISPGKHQIFQGTQTAS